MIHLKIYASRWVKNNMRLIAICFFWALFSWCWRRRYAVLQGDRQDGVRSFNYGAIQFGFHGPAIGVSDMSFGQASSGV